MEIIYIRAFIMQPYFMNMMKMHRAKRFFFIAFPIILLALKSALAQQGLQKVTAHIFTRQAEKGYVTTINGDLYYTANGNMVSNFTFPKAYVMVTNNKGEVRIYDPEKNTVMQFQNSLFSTTTTPFYYFFSGKTGDMGLNRAGYKIIDTKFENTLVITTWKSSNADQKNPIALIKLVHDQNKPTYMDYEDAHHHILRKVYYYDYTNLNGVDFPKTFTEILYQDKDSTVTKTVYTAFKVNDQAVSTLFEFKVPGNAKLIKQ